MLVPVSYNVRSVTQRWRNTGATVLAIGLAVAVIITIFAMQGGIEKSLVGTGTPGNIIVMRAGSTAELNSAVTQESSRLIRFLPGIAKDENGVPMVSTEVMQLQNISRVGQSEGVNVTVRGLTEMGARLRPAVRLIEGRWFELGKKEAVVSTKMQGRFGLPLGGTMQIGKSRYTIVGVTDASGTAYDSEIWTHVDDMREDYNYDFYSTLFARLERSYSGEIPQRRIAVADDTKPKAEAPAPSEIANQEAMPAEFQRAADALAAGLDSDVRLSHTFKSEQGYYASQTMTGKPLQILGGLLMGLMGPGAALAAMNAMFAAIASRTREIGTLRVLGFKRGAVLLSFLLESLVLALLGGLLGCATSFGLIKLATTFDVASFGTMNFTTFSEFVFQFNIERGYLVGGMVFAGFIGFLGGLLPALAASRLPVLSALKAN